MVEADGPVLVEWRPAELVPEEAVELAFADAREDGEGAAAEGDFERLLHRIQGGDEGGVMNPVTLGQGGSLRILGRADRRVQEPVRDSTGEARSHPLRDEGVGHVDRRDAAAVVYKMPWSYLYQKQNSLEVYVFLTKYVLAYHHML